MVNDNDGDTKTPTDVHGVNMKLPPFWDKNPQLWFVQIETQFSMFRVTADASKYCLAVASLPVHVCDTVFDILTKPPDTGKYEALKKALNDRHAISEESRLEKLLERADLGDQRPSEVLRQMQRLSGDTVTDTIIKKLWLRRLPKYMKVPLVAVDSDKSLQELSDLADKMFEAGDAPEVNAMASSSQKLNGSHNSDDRYKKLENQISQIQSLMQKLSSSGRPSRSSSRSKSRTRESRSKSRGHSWCWYHHRFGPKALKCQKPCGFIPRNASEGENNKTSNITPNY